MKTEDIVLLDVRTKEEYQESHIPQSILLPLDELQDKIKNIVPDKNKTIVVYCRSGVRSNIACEILKELNYLETYDLGGIIDIYILLYLY